MKPLRQVNRHRYPKLLEAARTEMKLRMLRTLEIRRNLARTATGWRGKPWRRRRNIFSLAHTCDRTAHRLFIEIFINSQNRVKELCVYFSIYVFILEREWNKERKQEKKEQMTKYLIEKKERKINRPKKKRYLRKHKEKIGKEERKKKRKIQKSKVKHCARQGNERKASESMEEARVSERAIHFHNF